MKSLKFGPKPREATWLKKTKHGNYLIFRNVSKNCYSIIKPDLKITGEFDTIRKAQNQVNYLINVEKLFIIKTK